MDNRNESGQASTAAGAARQRLDRLENFIAQDPGNVLLIGDAFDTALACAAWERAAFHLSHGEALGAGDPSWRLRRADLLLATARWAQAVELLDELISALPATHRIAALRRRGALGLRAGGLDETLAALAPFLEDALVDPRRQVYASDRELQTSWLRLLHRARDYERAIAWVRDPKRSDDLSPWAAGVASLIAIDADRFDLATQWCAQALRDPEDAVLEAWVSAAVVALHKGDTPTALNAADRAVSGSPQDGRGRSTRGFVRLSAKDLDGALQDFLVAVASMPEHIGTWHGLGWTQLLLGTTATAIVSFQRALALDRNFADTHGALSVAMSSMGRRQEALEHAERSIGLDPDSVLGRLARELSVGPQVNRSELDAMVKLAVSRLGVKDVWRS